jgi:multiple sugar transport system substrate-binding protein
MKLAGAAKNIKLEGGQRMKRVFVLFTLLMFLVSMAGFSAGQQGAMAEEKSKIVWSEWWDVEWGEDTVEWIMTSFEEKHPDVDVQSIFAPNNQMFERLLTVSQSEEAPDVIGMEGHWAVAIDKLGVLADLDPLLEQDPEFRGKLPDSALMPWQGQTKIIWLYMMAYHFFYNTDTFAQKGVEPPDSWENLPVALRKLRDPDNLRYGLALQFSLRQTEHMTTRMFMTPLVAFRGRLLDEKDQAVFNSSVGVEVLEYWKKLIDEDLVYPDPLDTDPRNTYELLAEEAVSMMLIGPWVQSVVEQSNPDIQLASAPPFGGSAATGSGISLSAKTKHPEMAWEFMKHLWSDEVAVKMVEEKSMMWATKKAFESPAIQQNLILKYQPQMINDPDSQSIPILPEMEDLFRVLSENMQAYYLGRKDAKAAVDDAAAYWNQVMAEYK